VLLLCAQTVGFETGAQLRQTSNPADADGRAG
jgi:hypothetical protein